MSNSLNALAPFLRPWARDLVNVASTVGLQPRITSTLRTHTQQARLYRDYLAGRNQYPVAPPGASAHELGLAFDMVVSPMYALLELGKVWEGWGGVWGGRFQDEVHFEYPGASQHAATRYKSKVTPYIADVANVAAGFIPGPLGIAASFATPFEPDEVPWWDDPQGALHGLWGVLTANPFK